MSYNIRPLVAVQIKLDYTWHNENITNASYFWQGTLDSDVRWNLEVDDDNPVLGYADTLEQAQELVDAHYFKLIAFVLDDILLPPTDTTL